MSNNNVLDAFKNVFCVIIKIEMCFEIRMNHFVTLPLQTPRLGTYNNNNNNRYNNFSMYLLKLLYLRNLKHFGYIIICMDSSYEFIREYEIILTFSYHSTYFMFIFFK